MKQFKIDYRKKGYILLQNFFNCEEMLQLTQWTIEVMNWPTVKGKWLKYYELLEHQEKTLSRIENFVAYHKNFKKLVKQKKLLAFLAALIGEPVLFFKEKLNLKAAGARGYTPHQDAPAFFDIDYHAISIFIAIDPATINNGCLYFIKEGQYLGEIMLQQNLHNHALNKTVVDSLTWEPIECNPGDVIVFSSYAPHYSPENKTSSSRRAIFLTFGKETKSQGKTQQYYDKKRKIFPQDSEKRVDADYTEAAAIYSYSSPVIINSHPKNNF